MSWHKTDLTDVIALIQSGSRPKGGVSTDSGEVMSLGGENIVQQGGIDLKDVKRVPHEFYTAMTKGHLQDRDVLINKDGANTGKVGQFRDPGDGPACINEHLFLLRGKESRITQEYLYYALLSERGQTIIRNRISGSAQPGLKSGFINNFPIDLPESTDEQGKISEILGMLDRAIEQTKALIAKQQRIKTGLMQDLLTKGIDEHGNIRSEATHAFKDSPLGQIPVEWEAVKIEAALAENPKNGYSPKEREAFAGTLMLGLGCLTVEGFKPVQLKNAPADDSRVYGARLNHGDFLISRSNTRELVGLVGIFKEIGTVCIYPDLMVRLRFDGSVSSEFMEHAFRHHVLRRQITGAAIGTSGSMVKINSQVIKNCHFSRPPRDEQESIVRILGESAKTILEMNELLEKLRSLKRGLMHDLLTGKRRVTPLLAPAATA